MEQAEQLRKSELKDVIANIRSMMNEYGLTVEDLGFKASKPVKASNPTEPKDWKYKNPANPHKGWTGKGRVPDGIKEYVAKGGKLEELLIN